MPRDRTAYDEESPEGKKKSTEEPPLLEFISFKLTRTCNSVDYYKLLTELPLNHCSHVAGPVSIYQHMMTFIVFLISDFVLRSDTNHKD